MIVPSFTAILAFTTVALAASANYPESRARAVNKRQAVNATPSQALNASVFANAIISQIIVLIIQQAKDAAAAISNASAASVAKTATTSSSSASATGTSTSTSSKTSTSTSSSGSSSSTSTSSSSSRNSTSSSTSSSGTSSSSSTTTTTPLPQPTCFDTAANSGQLAALISAPGAGGVCSQTCVPLQNATNACVTGFTTQAAFLACICSSNIVQLASSCGKCDDLAAQFNTGFYTLRANTFCNQCSTLGLYANTLCPALPALPDCPVVSSSSSTSTSTSTSTTKTTSTSTNPPAPTGTPCFDTSVNTNQVPTVLGASVNAGACSSSCAQFNPSAQSCLTNFAGAGFLSCVCDSFTLNAMFQCAGCEDSASIGIAAGYYSNRALTLCSSCMAAGFQPTGTCPAPVGNVSNLPACSTSGSSSASSSTSSTGSVNTPTVRPTGPTGSSSNGPQPTGSPASSSNGPQSSGSPASSSNGPQSSGPPASSGGSSARPTGYSSYSPINSGSISRSNSGSAAIPSMSAR